MKLQSTTIKQADAKSAVVELLLEDKRDAETTGGNFLRARVTIPFDSDPYVLVVQKVALEKLQSAISEQIAALIRTRAGG